MSISIILRLALTLIFAFLGWELGLALSEWVVFQAPVSGFYQPWMLAALGALFGLVVAPFLAFLPYRALRAWLRKVPARTLIMGLAGLVIGLIVAALLALPLSLLPGVWGVVSPLLVALLLAAVGALTLLLRDRDILAILGLTVLGDEIRRRRRVILLDTSVIIDGRIADIYRTGFISGTMIVPRFVLDELQHIADSPDSLRRARGRRGLDILNTLQKDEHGPLEISGRDIPQIREVDGKLIKLAQELNCSILTNDYNLNRVAEIQGVRVLNINELANAVKAVVLPGERLRVRIIQEGKESGQGVGYLDDGTMVVVEEGRRSMDMTVEITVTRVLQTVAGRMIFGQLQDVRR